MLYYGQSPAYCLCEADCAGAGSPIPMALRYLRSPEHAVVTACAAGHTNTGSSGSDGSNGSSGSGHPPEHAIVTVCGQHVEVEHILGHTRAAGMGRTPAPGREVDRGDAATSSCASCGNGMHSCAREGGWEGGREGRGRQEEAKGLTHHTSHKAGHHEPLMWHLWGAPLQQQENAVREVQATMR